MNTNALIHEKSPYLRQHAHNPVDWLPWGQAAFEKARAENKPIFLSIGYSTCHWCHVMAHESFEDNDIAQLLNRDFVPIKVDREERPDVDRIYMLFVQASTGSGGWPMSVWLTPDLKPFFGGTYFPPDSRYGRPGFGDVLARLAQTWKQDRERVVTSGGDVLQQLRKFVAVPKDSAEPDRALFAAGFGQFGRMFDATWGGFGGAPKFPRPVALNYLLRFYAAEKNEEALEMVTQTLSHMAAGGMNDHLGGGFHRYSVDERWFVPHFEKMLYDQAQLAVAFLEAYQITQRESFADAARDILNYVVRDLRSPEGGFFSAEDADSPDPEDPTHSGEGSFYIWRQAQIQSILGGADAQIFSLRYGVEAGGNVENDPQGEFSGRNILFEARTEEEIKARSGLSLVAISEMIDDCRSKLLAVREGRPRPHLDNKVLTSWNGLMISALAKGAVVLGENRFREAAESAVRFLLSNMYHDGSGELQRRFCDGEAAIPGFLDDYAFFAQALLDLFETTSEPAYLTRAIDLARRGFSHFEDREAGGFFSTADGAPDLVLRMKDDYDGAEPTGNSVATDVLIRLSHLTSDPQFSASAARSLQAFAPKMKAAPTMAPQMTVALGRWLTEPSQVIIRCQAIDAEVQRRVEAERKQFEPNSVTLVVTDDSAQKLSSLVPFLGNLPRKGRTTVYRCRNLTCEAPEVID